MRLFAEARASAVLLAALMAFAIGSPTKAQAKPIAEACTDSTAAVACKAYLSAARHGLQPYYELVKTSKLNRQSFDAAYSPAAQTKIMRWAINQGHDINNWPPGINDVREPKIEILRVVPHPACNRTLLVTRETWKVIGSNNQVLYSETKQIHTIVLGKDFKQVEFVLKGQSLKFAGC